MQVIKATEKDISKIMKLYRFAQDFMIRSGNPGQWGHDYPTREIVEEDIRKGQSFLLCQDGLIHGVFVICPGEDPTYRVIEAGAWINEEPYITIHRVAGDGKTHGIFRSVMEYCKGCADNIRIDTHEKNIPMQRAIAREGFVRCGIIYVRDKFPRIAYQWVKSINKDNEE